MHKHLDLLSDLAHLSTWAGSRFDWVQAGGGNVSLKTDADTMWVKASGVHLSEVTAKPVKGLAPIAYRTLRDIMLQYADAGNPLPTGGGSKGHPPLGECLFGGCAPSIPRLGLGITTPTWDTRDQEKQYLQNSLQAGHDAPSIETFMHAWLGPVVCHIHPIVLNILACQKNWRALITKILPESILVPYAPPGLPLAMAIANCVGNRQNEDLVIVLQNHGLIVSGRAIASVKEKTRAVSCRLEKALGFSSDDWVQDIWEHVQALHPSAVWAARDHRIVSVFSDPFWDTPPFLPDLAVLGGYHAVHLANGFSDIQRYFETYHVLPRVVIAQQGMVFLAPTVTQAKYIEDVVSTKATLLSHIPAHHLTLLDPQEINRLLGWDAEKYRQNMT